MTKQPDSPPDMRDVFALHIIAALIAGGYGVRDVEDQLYFRAWNIADGMVRTRESSRVAAPQPNEET